MAISFSIIILLMAVIILISINGLGSIEKKTDRIIQQIIPVDEASSNILISLLNEDTGIRGYLISGDKKFLDAYYIGEKQVASLTGFIDSNIQNYSDIKEIFMNCKYDIISIQDFFKSEIDLVRQGRIYEAKYYMYYGKTLVDEFRITHDNMMDKVGQYKANTIESSKKSKSNIVDIIIGVSIVIFAFILIMISIILKIISDDISKRKELNTSLEKTIKEQEDFFANISHELKTPLNVILSSLQLLEMYNRNETPLDASSLDRYVKIMKQNCFRLSKLSTNLIDMSKIEAGYIELHLRNEDIVRYVEATTMSVIEYGRIKNVNLVFDTDVEEKIMAFDPDKIERIMLNLLSNAIKFTNPGDEIMVSIKDLDTSIIISVKDSGIGIPTDKLDVIFERFKQVDKSLNRNTEGSGIGLSLVKSLVNIHGGKITVNSRPSYGSEFMIELPVRLIEADDNLIEKNLENHSHRATIEFSDIYFNE